MYLWWTCRQLPIKENLYLINPEREHETCHLATISFSEEMSILMYRIITKRINSLRLFNLFSGG